MCLCKIKVKYLFTQETSAWLDKGGTTVDETSQEYIYFLLSKCETLLVSGQVRYIRSQMHNRLILPLHHIDYSNVSMNCFKFDGEYHTTKWFSVIRGISPYPFCACVCVCVGGWLPLIVWGWWGTLWFCLGCTPWSCPG